MQSNSLQTPVEQLPYIGPAYAKRLTKLEIKTVDDLLHHYPVRYIDYSLVVPIKNLRLGELSTTGGTIVSIGNHYTKNGKLMQKAVVEDESGRLDVIWFNQPFLLHTLKKGQIIRLSGKIDWFGRVKVMSSPEYELVKQTGSLHTGRLVPVYPETEGISSKWLRNRISYALKTFGSNVIESLPISTLTSFDLLAYDHAIRQIHFPDSNHDAQKARRRLAFDELLVLQLIGLIRKMKRNEQQAQFQAQENLMATHKNTIVESLPFILTHAQVRVVDAVLSDISKTIPMNRLIQGDVGSGKTVIAAIAMYIAHIHGFSSALMAPTEILAIQHYQTINTLLSIHNIPTSLMTGSQKIGDGVVKEKNGTYTLSSKPQIVIGTQALLTEHISFDKLGLVVIDEQHRFGVQQRLTLREKGESPHLLTMTATPIPRTIALTMYGELDLSYLDELPKGRIPIKTWLVPNEKRSKAYEWIRSKVKTGSEQAFIICPLIEESESLTTVRAAAKEFEYLSKDVFKDLRLALLHGRLKPKEKDLILREFKEGKYDILVATPVVEVGIDIPTATIMMIEASERFGLSQLHQLRGRVGRSDKQSYCLLFTDATDEQTLSRLKAMEKTNLGSELAELDLKLRGPGEFFGVRQHGYTHLKIASFSDQPLIEETRNAAKLILSSDPTLKSLSLLREKVTEYTIGSTVTD